MSKEDLKQVFLRKKNTFHYSIASLDGDTFSAAGKFDFVIPPSAYPEHQKSQYAIFKLKSLYVVAQGTGETTERVSGPLDHDLSCFYVRINGLGIQPTIATLQNQTIRGSNTFFIPNENAQDGLNSTEQYQRISGGKPSDYEVVCSNPTGTQVSVEVFDGESDGTLIPNAVATDAGVEYFTIINFSIELLDL